MILEKIKQVTKRGLPSALFEIMLIFIGISLALAFDNWNTERNERDLEKEYLQSIYTNLNNNFTQIDENMLLNGNGRLKSAMNVANFVKGEAFDETSLLEDLSSFGGYLTLSLETSGYTSIRSYGLHIIKSAKLRVDIIELHDRHFDRLLTVIEGLMIRHQASEVFVPTLIEHGDFTHKFNSAEEWREYLQQQRQLRNLFIRISGSYFWAFRNIAPYLQHIHDVMVQLEQSLMLKSNASERRKRIEFWEWQAANEWPIVDPLSQDKTLKNN